MLAVRRIGVLLYDNCALLDFAGPASVFHGAGRQFVWTAQSAEPIYELALWSLSGGVVRTWEGAELLTLPAPELRSGQIDTLLVVGGLGDDRDVDPKLVAWLRCNHRQVRRVASVCSGAYILARAGLLDGHRVATHWEDCDALAERFPRVNVCRDAIYINEGNVWTSAGVTAGIDMALAMVSEDHGHDVASLVARRHLVLLKRSAGQSQFGSSRESRSVQGPLASLLQWIMNNPREDLRAERLAERVNMSLRNFYRAFRDATGLAPAEWVESARFEVAQRLLEQSQLTVDRVALRAGFSSYEHLRKVCGRRLGTTPAAYRNKVWSEEAKRSLELSAGVPNVGGRALKSDPSQANGKERSPNPVL